MMAKDEKEMLVGVPGGAAPAGVSDGLKKSWPGRLSKRG